MTMMKPQLSFTDNSRREKNVKGSHIANFHSRDYGLPADTMSGKQVKTRADRIRYIRDTVLLLTQEEMAAKLGVKRGSVGNWELNDENGISRKNLAALADLANCTMEWIETGKGEPPTERRRSIITKMQNASTVPFKNGDEGCYGAVIEGMIAGFGVKGDRAAELERLLHTVLKEQLAGRTPEEQRATRRALAQFATREFLIANDLLDDEE
jgi:DNA-binding XRE family transcriptional regulator